MPSASRPNFLRHFGRTPRRQPDFGDMGTAFGLDQAMDDPAPVTLAPSGVPVASAAATAARAGSWRAWLGRKLGGA